MSQCDELREAMASGYLADEDAVIDGLLAAAKMSPAEAAATQALAHNFVERIRDHREGLHSLDAFTREYSLSSGDQSEIVLDVVRRLYLSGEISQTWGPLLHLCPKLLSLQTVRKVLRFGASYAMNVRHGFTTQRRLPE